MNLAEALSGLTAPAEVCEAAAPAPAGEAAAVRCLACGHRCLVRPGRRGICRVRFNQDGVLRAPWGYTAALNLDPVEKKPLFHVLPGSRTLSFGMLGCSFRCDFCQNWLSSQALRDPGAGGGVEPCQAGDLARLAVQNGSPLVTSTYNEPLVTAEWAAAVFRLAKASGLRTAFVSNGYATPEVIAFLRPVLDVFKVDLKGYDDSRYRRVMGGALKAVLDSIERIAAAGFWIEVVTLVVPGLNDSDAELRSIARFLAGVSRDIPWHVTAFHPDYKMTGPERTPAATIVRAAELGEAEGLSYVYAGNLPGAAGRWESTRCPGCKAAVVERRGYRVLKVSLRTEGSRGFCGGCGRPIAGLFTSG